MNNHKKIKISLFALIVIVFISSITIAHPVYTTNTITGNPNCINENDLQKSVSFKVKKPILLPQDYKFQCGTVTTHEIHLLYGSQTLPSSFSNNASLPSIINGQLGSNSVSLDLVDVKGILGDEMFASKVGDTTQRIIDTYHDANQKNQYFRQNFYK